jgi:hypothetical protein
MHTSKLELAKQAALLSNAYAQLASREDAACGVESRGGFEDDSCGGREGWG